MVKLDGATLVFPGMASLEKTSKPEEALHYKVRFNSVIGLQELLVLITAPLDEIVLSSARHFIMLNPSQGTGYKFAHLLGEVWPEFPAAYISPHPESGLGEDQLEIEVSAQGKKQKVLLTLI